MSDGRDQEAPRRTGDEIAIPGRYQYDALHSGIAVQRLWHRLKIETLVRTCPPEPGEIVADVGCGSGVVADMLAERAAEVHAIDANPAAIEFASAQFRRPNLRFHLGLIDEVELPPASLDRVYLLEVIEHLYWEQLPSLFGRLAGWLRPGGRLFLTTPNYRSAWPVIEKAMDALRLAPEMGGSQHVSRPTRRKLDDLARVCGFEPLESGRAVGIAPFVAAVSWRLAVRVDSFERRLRSPLGNLLYALWGRP